MRAARRFDECRENLVPLCPDLGNRFRQTGSSFAEVGIRDHGRTRCSFNKGNPPQQHANCPIAGDVSGLLD
jgi:hypothetical protein